MTRRTEIFDDSDFGDAHAADAIDDNLAINLRKAVCHVGVFRLGSLLAVLSSPALVSL
jgi:hypothetical protein